MTDFIQITLLIVIIALIIYSQMPRSKVRVGRQKIIMDTCGFIDGRIMDLNNTGFIFGDLVVPDFVLHELQLLADGNDSHKRERARFGLDIARELQETNVVAIDRSIKSSEPTDLKLIKLAKKLNAALYTTDYNLNKLADIEGVDVLNVNELAQQLRPVALPGEIKTIKILQKGSSQKQGVGYLDDGTMVVVDGASRSIGKIVSVEIERIHQTAAGKMLFGNLIRNKKK